MFCPRYSMEKNVKVAFQVLIAPGFYTSNNETLGLDEQLDPKFDNKELEWSTHDPKKVRIYGLLIKIYDKRENNRRLNVICFVLNILENIVKFKYIFYIMHS